MMRNMNLLGLLEPSKLSQQQASPDRKARQARSAGRLIPNLQRSGERKAPARRSTVRFGGTLLATVERSRRPERAF